MQKLVVFIGVIGLGLLGCLKRSSETVGETTFESLTSGKNAGFRILPQTAARDALRPRVIYRCNDVQCGEAFQPSNEERDMFIPCDSSLGMTAETPVKPYVRLVGEGQKRTLTEREVHKKACETPESFEKIVSAPPPSTQPIVQGAPACRIFRRDKVTCESNAALGCRWVTHPSRHGDAAGGECIGTVRTQGAPQADPNLPGNFQVLSGGKPSGQWSEPEAYRVPGARGPNDSK